MDRQTDGRTDRWMQGEKQYVSRPFQGGDKNSTIHQNNNKGSRHVKKAKKNKQAFLRPLFEKQRRLAGFYFPKNR